jgi:hypothetical protein
VLPAAVEQLVDSYLSGVDEVAPGLVEGLYMVGSLTMGDFHPGVSDIDLVALVPAQPSDEVRPALGEVHRGLIGADRPEIETIYATGQELQSSPADVGPGVRWFDELRFTADGRNPVAWATLARQGLTIRGPEPSRLGIHDDPTELHSWCADNLRTYWQHWLDRTRDPATLTAGVALSDWGVAWAVLGVSRIRYTLATGGITSKSGAGHHALTAFPGWEDIVEEALRCRPAPMVLAGPDDLPAAERRRARLADFLDHAITTSLAEFG